MSSRKICIIMYHYESYTLMNWNIFYDAIEAPSISYFSYIAPRYLVLFPNIGSITYVPQLITSHTNIIFLLNNSLLYIHLNVKQIYSSLVSNLNIMGWLMSLLKHVAFINFTHLSPKLPHLLWQCKGRLPLS